VFYGLAVVFVLAFSWFVLSIVGLIPDEMRVVNRRFVDERDSASVTSATGLLAIGIVSEAGEVTFIASGTAWAISNDGFLLTARHIVRPGLGWLSANTDLLRVWVFINKRRLDARVVWEDSISDLALVKCAEPCYVPKRYRLASESTTIPSNAAITTIGFPEMPIDVEAPMLETELSFTAGTVSRAFADAAGTRWFEHTAPTKPGSSGGPVMAGVRVIGLNVKREDGTTQALDLRLYRSRILAEMKSHRAASKDRTDEASG
jgi:S1-C subfamily serine protease